MKTKTMREVISKKPCEKIKREHITTDNLFLHDLAWTITPFASLIGIILYYVFTEMKKNSMLKIYILCMVYRRLSLRIFSTWLCPLINVNEITFNSTDRIHIEKINKSGTFSVTRCYELFTLGFIVFVLGSSKL